MKPSHNRPIASLAEAERLIRAGRAQLAWARHGERQGDAAEAENCFGKALEILRDAVGNGHPQLALAWDRLGVLYEELDDAEEAETCYLRSLAAQQAAGWTSVAGGLTVRRLGRLYGRLGRHGLQLAVMSAEETQQGGRSRHGAATATRTAAPARRKRP